MKSLQYEGIYDIFLKSTAGSLGERVSEALRSAIIDHLLQPGERLVEAKLAKALNVSITPVRYAFTQLSKEGLIDIYPYCGTNVKVLTKEFVREVCGVRALLECEAAKVAFENITSEDIETLRRQVELLSNPMDSFTSLRAACQADTRFHDLIFERSGNKTLIQFWEMLRSRMEFITSFTKIRTDCALQKRRHMMLVEDLQARNREKFLADIYDHCINANFEYFIDG